MAGNRNTAVANPHVDVFGHCTGRMVTGSRTRPESTFDSDAVFAVCAEYNTAVEVNSRPERLDPPRRLLRDAVEAGCSFSLDTDAHAPGQLERAEGPVPRSTADGGLDCAPGVAEKDLDALRHVHTIVVHLA